LAEAAPGLGWKRFLRSAGILPAPPRACADHRWWGAGARAQRWAGRMPALREDRRAPGKRLRPLSSSLQALDYIRDASWLRTRH